MSVNFRLRVSSWRAPGRILTVSVISLFSGSTANFSGELVRRSSEFVFTNDSVVSGHPGVMTMLVYDKANKFTKDTQKINLKAGE